jgi:outer membrane protein assembly factor BamD
MSNFAPSTRLAVLCLTVLTLAACSSFRSAPINNADQLYDRAKGELDSGDYAAAIKDLELLESRFPFSNVTRQAQLDMLYAYYENGDTENVIDQADQFIRENPTHPRVDYAYYMKGLANFDRARNFLERWFRVDLNKRPPDNSRTSFQAFQQLTQRFPNSQYTADARQRMIFLRNRLAGYEVHVANYYLKRGAYVAALNRAKYAIENYDGAPTIKEALKISSDAYTKLGMKDLADKSALALSQNFPN